MCPTMTIGTPVLTAASNGGRSYERSVWRSWFTTGRLTWESEVAGPWFGKCLAAETIPALSKPSTAATPISATSCGSSPRSEEHTSELQSRQYLVCRLLLEKKKTIK